MNDNSFTSESCCLVYFDLETSGFSSTDDILQIAAKYEDKTFNVYIKPTQPIDYRASEVTGFKNINGDLYLNGQFIETIPLKDALRSFQQFLNSSLKPCLLVAHNASFHSSRLTQAIINTAMIEDFNNIVGFSDTLKLFKKRCPDRVGAGMFKLGNLAHALLGIAPNDQLHNAIYDVEILEKLSNTILRQEDVIANYVTYEECVARNTLKPLKGVITDPMIKKIASEGITFDNLRQAFVQFGSSGIEQLLCSEKENGKPRVTNNKGVVNKVINYFSHQ